MQLILLLFCEEVHGIFTKKQKQKHSILVSLSKPVGKLPEALFGSCQLKLKSSLAIKT